MPKIKSIFVLFTFCFVAMSLTSCYSYKSVVGNGAYSEDIKTIRWNHYLFAGLIKVSTSDSKDMARGAKNYTIHTRQTAVNWFISAITFSIYTPTTTTVYINKGAFNTLE